MRLRRKLVTVMKPIPAPEHRRMVSSTLHVLFMTPCLFVIGEDVRRWWHRRQQATERASAQLLAAVSDGGA